MVFKKVARLLSISLIFFCEYPLNSKEINFSDQTFNENNIEWKPYKGGSSSIDHFWKKLEHQNFIPPNYYLNETRRLPVIKGLGRAVSVNGFHYPEISNYVPNAYTEDPSKLFTLSFRGISKTRFCVGENFSDACSDGVLDFDFNLINKDNFSFNPKLNVQSLTNRGTKFGEASSLGFKSAFKLSDKWSIALGGENLIHLDKKVDLGRNFYFLASTFKKLNNEDRPMILFLNAGIGSDFYGYKGNGFLGKTKCFGTPNLTGEGSNKCSWGPIGSLGLAINEKISLNTEWFGYGYGAGVSLRPSKFSPITFSLYATDFISSFPSYLEEGCPNNSCKTRFYGSISLNF